MSIEYGRDLTSLEDFVALPPNSIITAGLEEETYRSLCLPYVDLFGVYAKGVCEKDEPTVAIYFDSYTSMYGFTSSSKPLERSIR